MHLLEVCKEQIEELERDAWDHMKIMNEKSKSKKGWILTYEYITNYTTRFFARFFWHKLNFNNLNKGKIIFFRMFAKNNHSIPNFYSLMCVQVKRLNS
jgi:hypothetical protein